jgi:uncharacterized protein (TIGR00297 family)
VLLMYMNYYACCNGDTWSSELGVLSTEDPYLITSLRKVPRGTNGAVSLLGTVMSILGGFTIGFTTALYSIMRHSPGDSFVYVLKLSLCGTLAGLFGSLLDSLLGATLQETVISLKENKVVGSKESDIKTLGKDILTNNMVNFISATVISILSYPMIYLFN